MKSLLAMAVVVLASSAAQAQYQFEYGGRTIRIDPDRGTVSIPGVYDNTGRKSKRAKSDPDGAHNRPATQDAKSDPQPAPAAAPPAPADTAATAPAPAAPPPSAPPPAVATTMPTDPAAGRDSAALPPPPAPPPPAPAAPAAPLPATVAAVPPAPPSAAERPRDPNSPVGVWLTEQKEGKVRIEPCGANLCGYSVDAKTNANGAQVLMNMRAGQGKWSGRILDPNTGSTYDSTIALKGSDTLRVQGCALGGMFCGGQTWSRLN